MWRGTEDSDLDLLIQSPARRMTVRRDSGLRSPGPLHVSFNLALLIPASFEARMSQPIIYIDRSKIREGRAEELRTAIDGLVSFVDEHEPQLIAYAFHVNEQAERMTVVAIHPDAASMEFHAEVAAPEFKKFADLVTLEVVEIYGDPSAKALEQAQQKALMLGRGNAVVIVEQLARGFFHLPM